MDTVEAKRQTPVFFPKWRWVLFLFVPVQSHTYYVLIWMNSRLLTMIKTLNDAVALKLMLQILVIYELDLRIAEPVH